MRLFQVNGERIDSASNSTPAPLSLNFSCENCQRRYTIADEKVRDRAVRIRCKACQHLMSVGPLAPEPAPVAAEEDRTRMVSVDALEKLRAQTKAPPAKAASDNPWEDEPTRAAPPAEAGTLWFVSSGGKQLGPFATPALVEKVHGGEIQPRNFMWKKGMTDWKRGVDIPELTVLFETDVSDPSRVPPLAAPFVPAEGFDLSPNGDAPQAERDPQYDAPYDDGGGSDFADPLDSPTGPLQSVPQARGPVQDLDAGALFSDLELSKVVRAPDLSDLRHPAVQSVPEPEDEPSEPSEPTPARPAHREPPPQSRPTRPVATASRATVAMSANTSGGGVFRKLLATVLLLLALVAGAGFLVHERIVEVPAEIQAQVDAYWPVPHRVTSSAPPVPVPAAAAPAQPEVDPVADVPAETPPSDEVALDGGAPVDGGSAEAAVRR